MARVIVVGAGAVGTMTAWFARARGHQVLHLDREAGTRMASVRNFGLIWVSGRAAGDELDAAVEARRLWGDLAGEVPGLPLRANGSITVAQTDAEVQVLEKAAGAADAETRGFDLLAPDEVTRLNPAIAGTVLAGLHCVSDAVTEPRTVWSHLQRRLGEDADYDLRWRHTARQVDTGVVVDQFGSRHHADVVILAIGDVADLVAADHLASAPLRRCRLQMLETEPFDVQMTTSIADGDSLRYYPAFQDMAAAVLPPPSPLVADHRMQLLLVQRADGGLTIGDTHAYDEPFPFDLDPTPEDHLLARAEAILGRPLPAVRRRWAGVYSQETAGAILHRQELQEHVWLATGLAGRGMTLSPWVASTTLDRAGL